MSEEQSEQEIIDDIRRDYKLTYANIIYRLICSLTNKDMEIERLKAPQGCVHEYTTGEKGGDIMTDLEKRVVEIIKKNHIQYRMWSDGNVLALREAIDFLELVDEHTAVAFQKVKRLLGEIEELKQRLISKDEDCKLWRERAEKAREDALEEAAKEAEKDGYTKGKFVAEAIRNLKSGGKV